MTTPKLTAIDTYGPTFTRAVLSESPTAEVVTALQQLLRAADASFIVEQIADELGTRLPMPTVTAALTTARRAVARKTRGHKLCL